MTYLNCQCTECAEWERKAMYYSITQSEPTIYPSSRATLLQAWCYDAAIAREIASQLSVMSPGARLSVMSPRAMLTKSGARLLASYINGEEVETMDCVA